VAGDRAGSGTRRRAADRAGLTGLRAGTARAVVGREVVSRMADGILRLSEMLPTNESC
jgi:hypothetical protein